MLPHGLNIASSQLDRTYWHYVNNLALAHQGFQLQANHKQLQETQAIEGQGVISVNSDVHYVQ
jgi:hypothetical protein